MIFTVNERPEPWEVSSGAYFEPLVGAFVVPPM